KNRHKFIVMVRADKGKKRNVEKNAVQNDNSRNFSRHSSSICCYVRFLFNILLGFFTFAALLAGCFIFLSNVLDPDKRLRGL
ncbi:MAG TPA: hypothetical protein PK337_11255, partial [Bacteroidia bacterium]|nr:hypothetical protein [Bacteroidia bacterium]